MLIRAAIIVARPVLPEPGMPLMAIIRRASSAVEQSFAGEFLLVRRCHARWWWGLRERGDVAEGVFQALALLW